MADETEATGDTVSALDRLRTIAEQATPGPWEQDSDLRVWTTADGGKSDVADTYSGFVAEFIASFDPPTVLALLDVAEAAEETPGWDENLSAALDRLREASS